MADLEDALKKLDRLTQEEARMANAEVLRLAHSIRDGVKIVDGKVEEVVDKVGDVGDRVQCVDDKVKMVIDGARALSGQLKTFLIYMLSDGKQARVAAKELGDKVSDIGVKIEGVGDKVQCVDHKVQVVIDGARTLSSQLKTFLTYMLSDGKQARVAANEITDKVSDVGVKIEGVGDKVKCVDHKVQAVIDGARGVQSVAKIIQRLFL